MPPPRGSQGLDFTPVLSHYVLLFTFVLAIVGWLTAFIGQCVATAKFGHTAIGTGWFGIFLQAFVIIGVLHTLGTDAIEMHRFQISVFTAVALVFAVIEVNGTIYNPIVSSVQATGAGWLLLAIVDILWVLYFTSEDGSLMLHLFNSMGTGGLTPPGRHSRRATMNRQSTSGIPNNGYAGGISSGGYVVGAVGGYGGPPNVNATRSMSGAMSNKDAPTVSGVPGSAVGANAPLMSGGGVGDTSAGSHQTGPTGGDQDDGEGYAYKAKALYAYTASADDPNEISFAKGEILEILDNAGKWWQAKKTDGTRGIAPSNYLQII